MPDPMSDAVLATARRMPKVLLHEHLDGGLRAATLLQLLAQRGLSAPATDAAGLDAWMAARAHAGSLAQYLHGFGLTVAAMASLDALARVAQEAAEDARADGVVLAEFRIAPLLFEPFGLAPEAVVDALREGLARSPLPSGLIVCAMRERGDDHVQRSAALARRMHRAGGGGRPQVIGFDLAGAEAGWPATAHAALLRALADDGLGLSLHAGEADQGERVLEAGRLGARRIGHGVRLADLLATPQREAVLDEVRRLGLHLEVCPSSNLHTGAARSIAEHPIHALWAAGISLSFHTDNRLISQTFPSREAALLQAHGLSWAELQQMGRLAADASFLPAEARQAARQAIDAWRPPDDDPA